MLEIKNITRIYGMSCNGRQVAYAGARKDGLGINKVSYYVFHFRAIGDGKEYNREQDIMLAREKNKNGKYEMFCMGLQLATEIEISSSRLKSPVLLAEQIRDVLITTEKWYNQTSNPF